MTFEEEISVINQAYFFKEFTYSKTTFSPVSETELELADNLIWLESELIAFQVKEREEQDDTTPEKEERWYKKKVLGVGTKQIRDTLTYLDAHNHISLSNHRDHQFDLDSASIDKIHKLVVFKPHEVLPEDCKNKKYHESQTAGIIHIIPTENYRGIIETLITPAEVMDYLTYLEALIQRWGEHLNSLPEQALVGHYIGGEENDRPELTHARFLEAINGDVGEWDITGIMHLYADRIIDSGGNPTDYYKIVSNLARLDRGALKVFKERYSLSLEKVKANELVQPYRFACPDLDLGFAFIPLTEEHRPHQRDALINFTTAHKYDQQLTKCIGMTFQRYGHEHYDVGWCLINKPWEYDEEIESFLDNDFPFREVRARTTPRY